LRSYQRHFFRYSFARRFLSDIARKYEEARLDCRAVAGRSLSAALRRFRGRGDEPTPEQVDAIVKTLEPFERDVVEHTLKISITSRPRILAVIDSVRYCVRAGVPGAFAECGVWRGGSVVAMIMTLQELGVTDRDVWLYDTFEGMTPPTEADTSPIE
jgi:hypothetical protein